MFDGLQRPLTRLYSETGPFIQMPGEEGYPTYLASRLASFFERAGVVETLSGATGSLTMILSVSPPGGDFTEPVTQACLRMTGNFLMLDTSLAYRRHFPAINWFQSYSLYDKAITGYFRETVSSDWLELKQRTGKLLQREEALREVAEIVGMEGLQDSDRLLMHTAEKIRVSFLAQNAFTDDAFYTPQQTFERIRTILQSHDRAEKQLEQGEFLEDVAKGEDS